MKRLKSILKFFKISWRLDYYIQSNELFYMIESSKYSIDEIKKFIEENFDDKLLKDLFNSVLDLIRLKKYNKFNLIQEYRNIYDFIEAEYLFQNKKYEEVIEILSNYDNTPNEIIKIKRELIVLRLIQSLIALERTSEATKHCLRYMDENPSNSLISTLYAKLNPQPYKNHQHPTISLCMIVKNEEEFLEGCLLSVEGLVDEIIIVDTGSTDKTKFIADYFDAQIYDFEWIQDFSAARNESIKNAKSDWILYLDADERLKLKNRNYLNKIITSVPDKIGAILCTIESFHTKNDGDSEMHRAAYPRLFRNYGYPNIKFIGKIHEQISPSLRALGKEFSDSDIIIDHLGYNQDKEVIEQKVKRNYELLINQVKEEPLNGYAWLQLGQTLGRMNMNDKAIEALEFAIKTNNLSQPLLSSAYASLAQMVGNRKEIEKCLEYANKSLEISPEQQFARHIRGFALLYLNRFEEAEQDFMKVMKIKNNQQDITKSAFDIEIPMHILELGLKQARQRTVYDKI